MRRRPSIRLPFAASGCAASPSFARVLEPLRVGVDDWEGANFLVRGPTGAVEIVDNLFDLWRKAEALSGRRLDPLARRARRGW